MPTELHHSPPPTQPMSFAPVANPPALNAQQREAANVIAQLPAMVRLQGQLDGTVRNMESKINTARAAGIEPPGALVQMVADARTRAATLRANLATIHDQVRNAVREAVFRGWLTQQQAIDAGVFRAPPELAGNGWNGLGILPLIIVVAAVVVLLLPAFVVVALNTYKANAIAAQTQAVQSAAQLQAWWTANGFSGSPTDPTAPTPGIIPGATRPTPGSITSSSPNTRTTLDRVLTAFSGTTKTALILAAAAVVGVAFVKNRKAKSHG